MLIYDLSVPGRVNRALLPKGEERLDDLPPALLRRSPAPLPEVSELDVVRHYTRLSQKNFAVDTTFYPLGSCTMKYNPRVNENVAAMDGFAHRHPLAPAETGQGVLACLFELQEMLKEITGMAAFSLAPMAGAQGEFAGLAMIRAWHHAQGDDRRMEVLVPDAAHGTNPATATMCGCTLKEIPTDRGGNVDLAALAAAVGPQTAGLMLTNPSTLGVYERDIAAIQDIVHRAGGLSYYDGANLNAVAGRVRPADMGFDVVHLNLHKTFSTPHGGGGPGAGPVGVSARLEPFLPAPLVVKDGGSFRLVEAAERPQSIGRLSAFQGNVGVLLRAWAYLRLLGSEGLQRVSLGATLNAAWLRQRLQAVGFDIAFPERRASHEFIISLKKLKDHSGVSAKDVAKRLLDKGFYAPTTYFPLLVPECLLIEPTETETPDTLEAFATAMAEILAEAQSTPELLTTAPHTLPVGRLDEVQAARHLDLARRP